MGAYFNPMKRGAFCRNAGAPRTAPWCDAPSDPLGLRGPRHRCVAPGWDQETDQTRRGSVADCAPTRSVGARGKRPTRWQSFWSLFASSLLARPSRAKMLLEGMDPSFDHRSTKIFNEPRGFMNWSLPRCGSLLRSGRTTGRRADRSAGRWTGSGAGGALSHPAGAPPRPVGAAPAWFRPV